MKLELDEALNVFISNNALCFITTPRYSWDSMSISAGVKNGDGDRFWVKITVCPNKIPPDNWQIEKMTDKLDPKVIRPGLIKFEEWNNNSHLYKATIHSFISDRSISTTPVIDTETRLPYEWFHALNSILSTLEQEKTTRITIRQEQVTAVIQKELGQSVDATIQNWNTIHGDLHWGNITYPQLAILDWDTWGLGPASYDVALLAGFAVNNEVVLASINEVFHDKLSSRDGLLMQFYTLIEIRDIISKHGDYVELKPRVGSQ